MGLNNSGGNITYLKISQGRIAKRCQETDHGAIKCTNKEGNRVWFEQRFTSISGHIRNVFTRDHDYGKDLCIDILDGSDRYQLQMPYDSKYTKGFLRCLPNIDISREIYFTPWMKEVVENGATIKKTALYLSYGQGDENKIDWYWTKDNPMGLPSMVQTKYKGKDVWDDTEQLAYLMAYLNDTFLPKLGQSMRNESTTSSAQTDIVEYDDIDQLPF